MALRDGTYEIVNIGTGQYFDLRQSELHEGNNIIGYRGHGGSNQKWVLRNGEGYIRLHSLISQSAGVATTGHQQGSRVVVKGTSEHLILTQPEVGKYRIAVVDQQLFFRLPNNVDNTEVQLDPVGLGNDLWEFNEIPTR